MDSAVEAAADSQIDLRWIRGDLRSSETAVLIVRTWG
jgi:hypothetical protein